MTDTDREAREFFDRLYREQRDDERGGMWAAVIVVLLALAGALLVAGVAFADELVREGRYELVDDQNQPISQHNELHVAIREGQAWSREHDGRTFRIDPPRYRGSSTPRADPPIVTPPPATDAIHVAPGDDLDAAIARLQPGGTLLLAPGVYRGGLGEWTISGLSADQPTVVAAADPADPPLFLTDGEGLVSSTGSEPVSHVVFRDLRAVANHRDPDSPDFGDGRSTEVGITWRRAGQGVRFEGVTLEFFANGANIGQRTEYDVRDITLHRCVLRNAYLPWDKGHSQGLFADRVEGLTVTECVFDHNGWNEQVGRAKRTGFNQNVYLYQCSDVTIEDSVFRDGSNMGLKVRADRPGVTHDVAVRGCLFVGNLTGLKLSSDPGGDETQTVIDRVEIAGNVFTHVGGDLDGTTLGNAIVIQQTDNAVIAGNLFIDKTADTNWYAINVDTWRPNGRIEITSNVVDRWPAREPLVNGEGAALPGVTLADNRVETGAATHSINNFNGDLRDAVRWLFEGIQ